MLNGLALCAGAGGLELGVDLGLRYCGAGGFRIVGYVERDSFAAATLVARMEAQTVGMAPIWSDVATFDGRPWRGCVDIVTAGFPCQPVSHAGRQLGVDDDRWLWPDVARIIAEVNPTLVFLENVPAIRRLGLDQVLGTLADLGFDAEWGVLGAADVGAPHIRRRWFCLAYTDSGRRETVGGGRELDTGEWTKRGHDAYRRDRPSYWPDPPPQPSVGRVADGLAAAVVDPGRYDTDRLRTLGNGVVPLAAAAAFVRLAERAGLTAPHVRQ